MEDPFKEAFLLPICSIWYIMSLGFMHCIQSKSVNTTGGRGRDSTKWGWAVGWRGRRRRIAAGSHLTHSHGPGGSRSVQGLKFIKKCLVDYISCIASWICLFKQRLLGQSSGIFSSGFTCWLPLDMKNISNNNPIPKVGLVCKVGCSISNTWTELG